MPLLEQTTRRFTAHRQYKADIRYLRLWILYSKYIDAPRDIFRFLEVNDIGTNSASFYEEWATIEEASRSFKEAESIYMLGVHRKAEPLNRLKRRKDDFLSRKAARPDEDEVQEPEQPSVRPALGGTQRTGLGSSTSTQKPNGQAFAVFSDDSPNAGPASREGQWDEFGTRDARRRENVKDATPWTGETLSMNKSTPPAPPTEKLQVFRDEVCSVLSLHRCRAKLNYSGLHTSCLDCSIYQ